MNAFSRYVFSHLYPSALSHELHSISAIQGKETKAQKQEAEAGLQILFLNAIQYLVLNGIEYLSESECRTLKTL